MVGSVLVDRYRLEELIGEGGMAEVYRALDLRTGHRVAVKFLRQGIPLNPGSWTASGGRPRRPAACPTTTS